MLFRKMIRILVVLLLVCGAEASRLVEWKFDSPQKDCSNFSGIVNGLSAEVISKNNETMTVVSFKGETALVFNNSTSDSDPKNKMLLVKDNDLLTGHDGDNDGLRSLTIELEFKPKELKQCQLVRKTSGTTDVGYQLWMTKDGSIGFSVSSRKGKYARVISRKQVTSGKWHKVTATWDGRYEVYNMDISVDGYISWSGGVYAINLTNTDSPLTIGGLFRDEGDYGQFFMGEIKRVAISYNRPDLLSVSGKVDPFEVIQTGKHLKKQSGFIDSDFIYVDPPTPECHASTVVDLGNSEIGAAWFGGTHEGHTDVGIWFSRYESGKWSRPICLARAPQHNKIAHLSLFNPVLFRHSNGTIYLFYKEGLLEHMESRLMTSNDNGRSWSSVIYYEPGLHGPSKNKPIELNNGEILCAANGYQFEVSSDLGKTWKKVIPANPDKFFGIIQGTILNYGSDLLQVLYRTREGFVVQTWSEDNGETWLPLEKGKLPNNNSGFDAVTLKDGRQLLVYNHVGIPDGKWGGPRTPLNLAVSKDGKKWQAALVLEDEPGEYSYPSIIQGDDGLVYITYTWKRVRIKYAVVDPDKLEVKDIVNGEWPKSDINIKK